MGVFISLAKGFEIDNPQCFRCGDCCMQVPPELTNEEVKIIEAHLNSKDRKIFRDSLTTDQKEADPKHESVGFPIPQAPGCVGWLKAPCPFLDFETHKGKERTRCKIFKIRPVTCRRFFCGKEHKDEPLIPARYKYELSQEEIKRLYNRKDVFYKFAKSVGLKISS